MVHKERPGTTIPGTFSTGIKDQNILMGGSKPDYRN